MSEEEFVLGVDFGRPLSLISLVMYQVDDEGQVTVTPLDPEDAVWGGLWFSDRPALRSVDHCEGEV